MKKSYIAPQSLEVNFIESLTPLCTSSFETVGTTDDAWSNKRDFSSVKQKNPIWSNMQED